MNYGSVDMPNINQYLVFTDLLTSTLGHMQKISGNFFTRGHYSNKQID
jgi:hypothetical protein